MKNLNKKILVSIFSTLALSSSAHACQWQAEIKNLTTQEIKYYQVGQDKKTGFLVELQSGEAFAGCNAFLQDETIKKQHENSLEYVETGIIMCAYARAPGFPISANASRFIFKDGSERNNTAIMNLFSAHDQGQKPIFELRLSCRS